MSKVQHQTRARNKAAAFARLSSLVQQVRQNILHQVYVAGSGHIGGALSMTEIMVAIGEHHHQQQAPGEKLELVISKGHSAACLYAWLVEQGVYPRQLLNTYRQLGSPFQAHVKPPTEAVPGLAGYYPSGSLTHGLSLASGIAIAQRLSSRRKSLVYCVLGDTEMQGGQIWETANQIAFHGLSHVVAICDDNGLGNDYATRDTLDIGDISARWRSIGWNVVANVDGHNVAELLEALSRAWESKQPTFIQAKTIKGKGVSFFENDNIWHGQAPNREQFLQASKELRMPGNRIKDILSARDARAAHQLSAFPKQKAPRDAPADVLLDYMKRDERIVVVAPELAESTRAAKLQRAFPDRVFNFGVQEPNAMDALAGLAFQGRLPVFLSFTNFALLRTVDQVFQNIAPFGRQAVIIGTHDGFIQDGLSVTPYNHYAIARSFYGSRVLTASDYFEAKGLMAAALDEPGYTFLFIQREDMPLLFTENDTFKIGVAKIFDTSQSNWFDREHDQTWADRISQELAVFVAGAPFTWLATQAAQEVTAQTGKQISVVAMSSIKPLDSDVVEQVFNTANAIAVIEKHSPIGGLFSALAEHTQRRGISRGTVAQLLDQEWIGQSGTPDELISAYGMDQRSIANFMRAQL